MLKRNLLKAALFLVLFPVCAPGAHSQATGVSLSAEGQNAYDFLLVAERFESDAIGYRGAASKLVDAYNAILKEPSADAALKQLLARATLPGKLYSLCGLFFTDYSFFRMAIEGYRHNDEIVYTLFGCIGGAMRASELIEAKNPIIVDINHPQESLREYFDMDSKLYDDWTKRKKKKKTDRPPAGHEPDILNGGYPVMYRDKHSAAKSGRLEQIVGRERGELLSQLVRSCDGWL